MILRSRFRRLKPEIGSLTIRQAIERSAAAASSGDSPLAAASAAAFSMGAPPMGHAPMGAFPAATPAEASRSPVVDDDAWPMPVEDFQDLGLLEPGDVLLTTKLNSLFSFLVRKIDNGSFAHAALVFLTPEHKVGVDRSYFLQTTFSGVGVEGFSKIVAPYRRRRKSHKASRYVVGVKRLEAPWVTQEMRNLVAGRMLRFINDDNYNFSLLAALALAPNFWFRLRDALFGRAPSVEQFVQRRARYSPVEFICSGFVQFAYVDMISAAVELSLLDPSLKKKACGDVIFSRRLRPDTSMEDLIAVKPAELAASPNLTWKYLIFDGLVYRVRNNQEAETLMRRFEARDAAASR